MTERAFPQPVLREFHRIFTREMLVELGELNKDIVDILTTGSVRKSDLYKSERLLDPNQPGSRGGKWYRDQHGHVRYGTRPTPRFNSALSEDEAQNLETNLQTVMSAGPTLCLLNFIAKDDSKHLTSEDANTLLALGETARANGQSLRDTYAQFMAEATVGEYDDEGNLVVGTDLPPTPEDIEAHWARFTDGWAGLTKKEGFAEAIQASLQKIQDDSTRIAEKLETNAPIVSDLSIDISKEQAPIVALRMASSMLMHGWGEIGATKPEKPGRRKLDDSELGRFIIPDRGIFEGILHADMLSSSQVATLVLAAKQHHPLLEEREAATEGSPKNAFQFQWFGNHYDLTQQFFSSFEKEHNRVLTPEEKKQFAEQFQHVSKTFVDMMHDANRGNDGGGMSQLFDGAVKPEDLFASRDLTEALARRTTTFQALRADSIAAQDNEDWAPSPTIKATLFPHQARYLNWMYTSKKGINAGGTGLGKTLQAIALTDRLIHEGKEPRGIIATTPSVLGQWVKEIAKYRPGSKVVVLHDGMSRQDKIDTVNAIHRGDMGADFVLMSSAIAKQYSEKTINRSRKPAYAKDDEGNTVRDKSGMPIIAPGQKGALDINKLIANHDSDDFLGPLARLKGAMFVDEAHTGVAGTRNQQNSGWAAFKSHMAKRDYGFLMTATPMSKDPGDLYNMMSTVVPEAVGPDKKRWLSKISVHTVDPSTGKTKLTGYSRLGELNGDIRPFVYALRKTDPEVAKHVVLPPKEDINLPMTFEDPAHKDMYDKASHEVMSAAKGAMSGNDPQKHLNVFQKIMQQRQLAITPELVDPSYTKRTPKIQGVIDIVKNHFSDPGNVMKPVLVFSSFPSVFPILQRELAKEGIHPSLMESIHADVDSDKRAAIQDATNEGKLKVVMLGTASGGAGLNLQKASDSMIMLDKPMSPAELAQAIGRIHRTGATANKIKQYNMQMENSYDEKAVDSLGKKVALADSILYAHRGEEAVDQLVVQSLANLVKDLELRSIPPEEKQRIRDEYKKTIGTDLPTPDQLRHEFKIDDYVKQQEKAVYKDLFGQHTDDALRLAKYRLDNKLLTSKDYTATVKKLKKDRAVWMANVGKMPEPLTKEHFSARSVRPVQPDTEYTVLPKVNFEKTSDLATFHQMVKQSKQTTPKDFANNYLREQIGDEEWNKPQEPGQAGTPEKALAFAREVFDHLLTSGGIVEREHNPNVDVSELRGKA